MVSEARRVGKLHKHSLPDENTVEQYEVYRCECNKEFFRGKTDKDNLPTWLPLASSPHYVEYEVDDSPLIGRYTPEIQGVPRPAKTDEPSPEDLMQNVPGLEGSTEFADGTT